ncbi:MAG: hypothetical protein QXN62_08920 [Candidatus Bathyarchaeia archaeon]
MVVADPTLGNELEASEIYGRFPLGISDLINLSIMKKYGVHEIYSSDKGFDKVLGFRRIFMEFKQEPGYGDFLKEVGRKR